MFLDIVDQYDCHSFVIVLWSPCSSHHLQDVGDRVVNVAMRLPVKELRPLDDDQMGGEVDAPGQSASGNQHL